MKLSAPIHNYGDVFAGIFFHHKDAGCGMDSIFKFFFQTGFSGLMGFFSPAAGEMPSGRRPFYPDDPVNPV